MKFCVSTLKSSYSPDTSFPYPLLPCPCKGLGTKLVYTGVRYEQCSSSLALCINMYRVWSYSYYHRLQLCSSKNIIAAVLSMVCQFFQIVSSYCSFECILYGWSWSKVVGQPYCHINLSAATDLCSRATAGTLEMLIWPYYLIFTADFLKFLCWTTCKQTLLIMCQTFASCCCCCWPWPWHHHTVRGATGCLVVLAALLLVYWNDSSPVA